MLASSCGRVPRVLPWFCLGIFGMSSMRRMRQPASVPRSSVFVLPPRFCGKEFPLAVVFQDCFFVFLCECIKAHAERDEEEFSKALLYLCFEGFSSFTHVAFYFFIVWYMVFSTIYAVYAQLASRELF